MPFFMPNIGRAYTIETLGSPPPQETDRQNDLDPRKIPLINFSYLAI